MFWGLTPAVDLLAEYKNIHGTLPKELNILIIGGADCRHVLQTIAKRYRHEKVKIKFYLIENCMENVAKQLLLIQIALQPQIAIGLNQKTKVFMELYGNTLVRPSVAKYLTYAATDLLKMVTDYKYLKQKINCVTLQIKYKERDYLENLVKFWAGKDEFNIVDYWDKRLRKTLGARYDSKLGAFDWDLHMRLHNIGGNQVCSQEYRNFRINGVAFSWLESEVSKPNRTMVCVILPNGERFAHYGYLGDMQTGPFVTFGLTCEDTEFLKSTHGQNSYRATDITERNLRQMFYEIENQDEYVHQQTSDVQLGAVVMKDEKLIVDIKAVDIIPRATAKCIDLENVEITILTISVLDVIKHKEECKGFFDIIYFGQAYVKNIDKITLDIIGRNQCLILVERQIFVLSNREKEIEDFDNGIKKKFEGISVKSVDVEEANNSYIRYILNKN